MDSDLTVTGSRQAGSNGRKSRTRRESRVAEREEGGGGEGGRGGGGGRRLSQHCDLPDLGLGPAAAPAALPSWKRATLKRRSFNL